SSYTINAANGIIYLNDVTIFNIVHTVAFLFIRIISATTSGSPLIFVSIPGASSLIGLNGIGDFCVIPLSTVITTSDVGIDTTNVDGNVTVEILSAGVSSGITSLFFDIYNPDNL
ncbi:MAG: hypothetical protein ACYDBX_04970, partial [Patescibacteria group bacterium]